MLRVVGPRSSSRLPSLYFCSHLRPRQHFSTKTPKSWRDIGLSPIVIEALAPLKLVNPTPVQEETIPKILKNKLDLVIADQTGSGKTLAYLLPLMHNLKEDEVKNNTKTKPSRPRAVILVPNRELGEQIYSIGKELSLTVKLKVRFFGGGELTAKIDQRELENGVDIMVITPGKLLQFLQKQWVFLKWTQHFVIEEADTLFEKGFKDDLKKLLLPIQSRLANEKKTAQLERSSLKKELQTLRAQPEQESEATAERIAEITNKLKVRWSEATKSTQFILAVATLSFNLQKVLNETFPEHRKIQMPRLHKVTEQAETTFISVNLDKHTKLHQCLIEDQKRKARTMIFCNTLASCRSTGHFLTSLGFKTSNFHGSVPPRERLEEYKNFKQGITNIIVCTDIASRGIDVEIGTAAATCLPHLQDHVILFDFPTTLTDFIHRSGRTARAGAKGKVTAFVQKKEKLLAQKIQSCIESGESLDKLNNEFVSTETE